ncbi:MAG TPA: SDR family oxidoreductase, partial [Acidimicrobiales bacterium]|nr:SDR family oxidoreductase [Acidimicrobiales bacterium]
GIKLAAPHIAARGGGSIISTASVAGLLGFPGLGAYGAAKGGVIALTRAAAMELAPKSIRVNCICPGGIVTPILYNSPITNASIDPDTLRSVMTVIQPLPRAGEPFDIANAALWLASDESSFVTGQAITVDGGLTAESDARTRGQIVTANLDKS